MFTVQGIDHVGLTVKDVRKSIEWYQELLGLKRLYEEEWGDFPGVVGIGDTSVAFFPTDDADVPLPAGLPIHHLAFCVDQANFEAAQETLRKKESTLRCRIIKLFIRSTSMIRMGILSNGQPISYKISWTNLQAQHRSPGIPLWFE